MTEPADHHSSDPRHHARTLQDMLNSVIEHARDDITKVSDPKAQALFETTAEVCAGQRCRGPDAGLLLRLFIDVESRAGRRFSLRKN